MNETEILETEDALPEEETAEIPELTYEDSEDENGGIPEENNIDAYVDEIIEEYISAAPAAAGETAEEKAPDDSLRTAEPTVRAKNRKPYVAGTLSAAAALVFTGIILFVSLISPVDAFNAVAFAPLILVFIGAEIIYAVIRRRSLSVSLDIKSMIIAAVLIALSFAMSAISKGSTPADIQRMHATDRITRSITENISKAVTSKGIMSIEAGIRLNADDPSVYAVPEDLMYGDIIDLTVNFSSSQIFIREFAAECRRTLDDLEPLGYDFGTITFIADNGINRYTLPVDWLYRKNYTEKELAQQVLYFGDDISDSDIPDIDE